jgi:acyl-CoA synthetase (AMP-forming)/AMP-acid ligase II
VNWIRERFRQFADRPVSAGVSGAATYADLLDRIDWWRGTLSGWGLRPGDRVGLVAEFHLETVALLHALLESACLVVPLSEDEQAVLDDRLDLACAGKLIRVPRGREGDPGAFVCTERGSAAAEAHPLLRSLADRGGAGFVIFTSGSTGKSKAVLLDHARMVRRYREKPGAGYRTMLFLKFEHIGGLDALNSVILSGGTLVPIASRQVRDVCEAIQRHGVEVLPTTPSFLTMLLLSDLHRQFDLSSLKIIAYGSEVMPPATLEGLRRAFPGVELRQKYGLSELGVLSTKPRDDASDWMSMGGKDFQIKVKDGILWIKSEQAMLGYLNAENPFDAEGWFNTGDRVEVAGEYYRILGRESEIINVAGEKVFPAEIEAYLMTLENVRDVVVRGRKNPITGHLVWAEFALLAEEDPAAFRKRITGKCREFFPPYKVPRLITIASGDGFMGARFKKMRLQGQGARA